MWRETAVETVGRSVGRRHGMSALRRSDVVSRAYVAPLYSAPTRWRRNETVGSAAWLDGRPTALWTQSLYDVQRYSILLRRDRGAKQWYFNNKN